MLSSSVSLVGASKLASFPFPHSCPFRNEPRRKLHVLMKHSRERPEVLESARCLCVFLPEEEEGKGKKKLKGPWTSRRGRALIFDTHPSSSVLEPPPHFWSLLGCLSEVVTARGGDPFLLPKSRDSSNSARWPLPVVGKRLRCRLFPGTVCARVSSVSFPGVELVCRSIR